MGKRIKLTRTDVYLLVLTALFCVCAAAMWCTVPRTMTGDYQVAAAEPQDGTVEAGRVNINTAGAAELDQLPGIGPVLAQRIVDWRTENGPFRTAEDLLKVEGIGPSTLENLQNCIITEETE